MTRQIKFRAWDGLNKKFSYWTMNDLCTYSEKDEKPSALDDWQQGTGLLDRHGKEIYEGDIVIQVGVKKDGKTRLVRKPRVVEWVYTKSNAGFNLAPSPESYADRTMLRTEVIGNIYENPELLSNPNKE